MLFRPIIYISDQLWPVNATQGMPRPFFIVPGQLLIPGPVVVEGRVRLVDRVFQARLVLPRWKSILQLHHQALNFALRPLCFVEIAQCDIELIHIVSPLFAG